MGGVWGGRPFLEPAFLPWNSPPSVLRGRCSEASDFIGRCEGKFKEIPAKIQIKHLGNLERIHRQNLKFIDQADVRGVWIWRAPGVGKSHFARQVLVAEGYYPKLNNKWWDGYQARRSSSWRTLMRKRLSSFTTTLRFGVLGEAQWFLGFGRGFGGGRPFLEPAFLPGNSGPLSITGALFLSERFYWSLRG